MSALPPKADIDWQVGNVCFVPIADIASSATSCIEVGTERPSALAALRLMTNSNLANCTIGRSPRDSSPAEERDELAPLSGAMSALGH